MKKYLNIILLLSILFSLLRCKDDNDETIDSVEKTIEIYCTYGDSTRQQVSDNETITLDLGDTLLISLTITGIESDSVSLSGTNNFEIEKSASLEYSFIATETGEGDIVIFSDDLSSNLLFNFFVEIPPFYYTLIIAEEPILVIDSEDEDLKAEIQEELKQSYVPDINDRYVLNCTSIDGGILQIYANDTITSTFSSSNILDLSDIAMSYNNVIYYCTLEESEWGYYYRYMKQDLTEEFQTEYPSETINEVSITTTVYFK
jgi:hypothetical protein